MKFTDFGFDDRLLQGIDSAGYENATPVQEQVIPEILAGKDLIAAAQTGTGKTAAFLLPLIQNILTKPQQTASITSMVIVPTRELAIQIAQHLEGLGYFTGISSIAVYGGGDGNAFVQEKKALSMGADIVVCTPGKMMSHIKMGYVKLQDLQYLILDEADRMLDMGFYDDILFVIKHLPPKRQTLLFSATMPPKIRIMAKTILHNPVEINIAISKPPDAIQQSVFFVYEPQKNPLINYLLSITPPSFVLIFCSSKNSVKQLNRDLRRMGWRSDEIHSDLDQEKREEVLGMFRSGRLPILIATDILSRGIDIDNIELVINYDVPHDGEDYVHRIGRTARAQTKGTAFTLVNEKEQRKFQAIEKLLEKSVPVGMVPENLGSTPGYNPKNAIRSSKPQRFSSNRTGRNNSR